MPGKPWYNNGEVEIQRGKNEPIPSGFVRGRLPLTPTAIANRIASQQNRTEAQKEMSNKKRSDTLKKTFANKPQDEKDATIEKRKLAWANKTEQEKDDYRKKLSASSVGKNRGKTPWNKGLSKETDERVRLSAEHTSATNKLNADAIKQSDPEYFSNWRTKINDVMRANNSFNRSVVEDRYYEQLVSEYGESDVVRWYSDDRYPYACDFYIKIEDKFIELNKTWTHGGHPFDETDLNDISKLEDWQERAKTSKYYQNAIYTWTVLDVKKQKTAKENHLNYKVIY